MKRRQRLVEANILAVVPVSDAAPNGVESASPPAALKKNDTWGAYMAIAASAFGLISDGYHNNLMTMTNIVFKKLYPAEYTSVVATRLSNALLVGEVIGQITIGLLCDRVGRKAGLILTTTLIVIGATLCTAAHGAHGNAQGLFWFMTFARGITGIGAGGEYPASSTSASEGANEVGVHRRGAVFIMVTDFPICVGGPLVVMIFLVVLSAAGETHLHIVWRVCFGIGIIFPVVVFFFRMRMVTSELYRKGAIRRRVPYWLAVKRYWRPLIGTAGTYFVYAFIDYPNGTFSATIIANVIKDGDLKKTAEWQLLLGAIALPGVIVGALLCNPLGRRYTMMLGFGGYIVFGLIIGCGYDRIMHFVPLLVVLYGLMIFMSNLGPGNITLLASAESYPTAIRGTFFGFSAAMGKVGAAVGTQVFLPIQENLGQRWTFIIAALFGAIGVLLTYVFVPDMTGVDLAVEDEQFFRYLSESGWSGDIGVDLSPLPLEDTNSNGSSENEVLCKLLYGIRIWRLTSSLSRNSSSVGGSCNA